MTIAELMALQNAALIGIFAVVIVWETVAPDRRFASGAARLRHVGANVAFGLVAAVITSVLVGRYGLDVELWAESAGLGLLPSMGLPVWVVLVIGFLIADFGDYAFHRFCHEWRLLWLVHSVHHSDPHLDATTTIRTHPGQMLCAIGWRVLIAFAFGIPVWLMIARDALAVVNTTFHHANVWIPPWLDARLRWLIVTPAMHRLHHSPEHADNDSNFGGLLSVWDRMLGTYREPLVRVSSTSSETGLRMLSAAEHQSVLGMLMTPWRARNIGEL